MLLDLMLAAVLQATPIVNPSVVSFDCVDHAQDDQHEIVIIDTSGALPPQTILAGDPPLNAAGKVEVMLNLQPVKFGSYRIIARAVAGAIKSADSVASDVWLRGPGAPSKPVVK